MSDSVGSAGGSDGSDGLGGLGQDNGTGAPDGAPFGAAMDAASAQSQAQAPGASPASAQAPDTSSAPPATSTVADASVACPQHMELAANTNSAVQSDVASFGCIPVGAGISSFGNPPSAGNPGAAAVGITAGAAIGGAISGLSGNGPAPSPGPVDSAPAASSPPASGPAQPAASPAPADQAPAAPASQSDAPAPAVSAAPPAIDLGQLSIAMPPAPDLSSLLSADPNDYAVAAPAPKSAGSDAPPAAGMPAADPAASAPTGVTGTGGYVSPSISIDPTAGQPGIVSTPNASPPADANVVSTPQTPSPPPLPGFELPPTSKGSLISADPISNPVIDDANSVNWTVTPSASGGYDGHFTYGAGWTPWQRSRADLKVGQYNENAPLTKDQKPRDSSKAAAYRASGTPLPDDHVDHIRDLQVGGADDPSNMQFLNGSVNQSLGAQLAGMLRAIGPGGRLDSFTIGD